MVSGVNTIVAGDNDGTVYRINKSGTYTDAITSTTRAFQWKVRQLFLTFGENKQKEIVEKIIVRGKNLDTAVVNTYVNDDVLNPITQNDGIFNRILSVFGIGKTARGTSVAVEVSGLSGGALSHVREIEIPNIKTYDNYV